MERKKRRKEKKEDQRVMAPSQQISPDSLSRSATAAYGYNGHHGRCRLHENLSGARLRRQEGLKGGATFDLLDHMMYIRLPTLPTTPSSAGLASFRTGSN